MYAYTCKTGSGLPGMGDAPARAMEDALEVDQPEVQDAGDA